MARKLYSVTADNIKDGRRDKCRDCPVALALKPYLEDPVVWPGEIRIGPVSARISIKTPRSVDRFICRFDSGKPVKPFRFYLDIPE